MRKLTRAAVLAITILGIAASTNAAMASISNWFVNVKASTDTSARAGQSMAKFGVDEHGLKAKISAGYDPAIAEVTTDGPGPWSQRWNVDMRPTTHKPFQSNTWRFRVTGSSLSDTVYITAWNPVAGDIVGSDKGMCALSLFALQYGKIVRKLYTFVPNENGAWSSYNGISGDYYQEAFHYTGEPLDFLLTIDSPEPSSILALLTGALGVAGMAYRRRH